MSARSLLAEAQAYAATYLESVADRHVGGTCDRRELLARLGGPLPEDHPIRTQHWRILCAMPTPGLSPLWVHATLAS
jgi:hypothetical protein